MADTARWCRACPPSLGANSGFSLNASVCIAGQDRAGLELLLPAPGMEKVGPRRERRPSYCARPPFALESIAQVPAGNGEQQVVYRRPLSPARRPHPTHPHPVGVNRPPRRPDPTALLDRHRYHGVLAPNAPLRAGRHRLGRDADLGGAPPAAKPLLHPRPRRQGRAPRPTPCGPCSSPVVPHPAARLPPLRRRQAHPRLHHRDRPCTADPLSYRRARPFANKPPRIAPPAPARHFPAPLGYQPKPFMVWAFAAQSQFTHRPGTTHRSIPYRTGRPWRNRHPSTSSTRKYSGSLPSVAGAPR